MGLRKGAHWSMNPVLLKPHGERRMQVVLKGRPMMEVGPDRPMPEALLDAVRRHT